MFSERVTRLTSSLVRDILAATQQPGMISFAGGLPAPETLTLPDWSAVPATALQYGPTEGEPELREAIAEQARTLGIACDASQVLVLSGSQQGIDLVAKLFIDPGTPVLTESPTYLAALQAFELFGARCHGLPLVSAEAADSPSGTAPTASDGIDPSALSTLAAETGASLAYLIPTFQNPSGTCYSASRRAEIARAVRDAGLVLFEDDPYRELVYEPVDRTPICAHMDGGSWIYQSSFSKSFMPGIRLGFLIASPELIGHLVRLKQAADLHTNRVGQMLALAQLRSPDLESHLATLRHTYAEKRDAMQDALTRHFSDLAEWTAPPGGLFFWLRMRDLPGERGGRERPDMRQLLPTMLERGVAFMPGEVFFPSSSGETGYMRLNFSHASAEEMERGVEALAEGVREQTDALAATLPDDTPRATYRK
jgi:DNA-binding transcriptional MocR family regulator